MLGLFFISTVQAVRNFLNKEIAKYDSYERVNESIKSLFESPESYTKTKNTGVGQTTILKFLGNGWKHLSFKKQSRISPALPKEKA